MEPLFAFFFLPLKNLAVDLYKSSPKRVDASATEYVNDASTNLRVCTLVTLLRLRTNSCRSNNWLTVLVGPYRTFPKPAHSLRAQHTEKRQSMNKSSSYTSFAHLRRTSYPGGQVRRTVSEGADLEGNLLNGDFTLIELREQSLSSREQTILCALLCEMFEHTDALPLWEWSSQILAARSTEVDRRSFIRGDTNNGLCQQLLLRLTGRNEEKYIQAMARPVREFFKTNPVTAENNDRPRLMLHGLKLFTELFIDSVLDCPLSIRFQLLTLNTDLSNIFPGSHAIPTSLAFYIFNFLAPAMSTTAWGIEDLFVEYLKELVCCNQITCESTQKILSILSQAWAELIDPQQLRLAHSIVGSQMRRDMRRTSAGALHIERFLAGLTLPKMSKVEGQTGKASRTI
ncbi:hypothetical protein PROFUN_04004 [Planoprotostelium fungivorum]|uniref:Uncharacterized protein n=1 Tax=Planoprotostelium fungivorum TaxID=1890364 RepID=A0A2P6NW47_9EUKA|nr:hypothetical protein PROFUN_04004 [Planoprotostelium fungivorum]